ncbi:MAG: NAD(P)H-hydrate dehydratase [Eubacteriales bacterium]|nr:NAD(P)H-hydrate dehydratase [Eubacteriales bacterium]MDD4390040.1 NAD(P)H-hydrate dehydratase [Eubacteriales bacterium]
MKCIIDLNYVHTVVKERRRDIHKGDCGRILIVAGSKGMAGAAVLSSRGALKSGAGLVTVSLPEELFPIIQVAQPEAMCMPRTLSEISGMDINRFDSVAIGPGIREAEENENIIKFLFENYSGTLIVDADGLNTVANKKLLPQMRKAKPSVIVTPHMGEAARLLGMTLSEIHKYSREEIAQLVTEVTGSVVVLKGAGTLVASGNGSTYINNTGNPGMATGGSGDVLTGVIASLAAQGLSPEDSAKAGVFIHGMAGDITADNLSEYGMIASDIAGCIPLVFKEILK